jgi:probable phosphoglycerate mutase
MLLYYIRYSKQFYEQISMKYLYYTRHGESSANTNDTWGDRPGSAFDLGLTELGQKQAKSGALNAKKTGLKPDLVICSPLLRTRETAAIIAETLGYPLENIEYNDLFMEVQVGELEGKSYSEFIKNYSYADFGSFKGAETIDVLQQRAAKALEYVTSRPEETVLIVSHGCFGRAFRRVIEGKPYTDEFLPTSLPLPYGEITQLLPLVKSS